MSLQEYQEKNKKIQDLFWQYFTPHTKKTIHAYLPIQKQKEVNTWPIIQQLQKEGHTIVIPKVIADNALENIIFYPHTALQEDQWGISSPVQYKKTEIVPPKNIDILLVPTLIVDQKGYRIGYGKGFYDRLLAQCRKDAVRIGCCFEKPVPTIADRDPWDVPLHYCITPEKVYSF